MRYRSPPDMLLYISDGVDCFGSSLTVFLTIVATVNSYLRFLFYRTSLREECPFCQRLTPLDNLGFLCYVKD